jgi:cytochrome c-type biogenesis protein CcmH
VSRLVLLLLFVHSLGIAQPAEDPALERRVMELAAVLRCLVCQNQTLADSNAPLAIDLRSEIREQLRRGASERAVADFMVARYGDFVLYRPPFNLATALLWAGPFLLLALGIYLLVRRVRRQRGNAEPALSDAERLRAARLLESGNE